VPRWGVTHHSHAPAHSHGAAPGGARLGMGRPGLQARLDVATGDLLFRLPVPHGIRPGTDWAALLRAAGFTDVITRSWLLLDPADPLGVDRRPDLFWPAAQTVYTGRAAEDDETGPRS